jgi:hypothetical protein
VANVWQVNNLPDTLKDALNSQTAFKRRNYAYTTEEIGDFAQLLESETSGREIGRAAAVERLATRVTTQSHLFDDQNDERTIIDCWCNPSQITWRLPRREAFQPVMAGNIRYSWRRRARDKNKGTYYSTFPVEITFQSGNIFTHPQGEFGGEIPPGLDDFYLFLKLLNEPRLMESGQENWHIVVHTSPVFPSIMLKGWFNPEGVGWPESSETGYGIQWTCSMEVSETIPKLWDTPGLQAMFGVFQR